MFFRLKSSAPRPRGFIALVFACASLLALPAGASAQFAQVFGDYRGDQRINGCSFSPGQLRGALGDVPPDIEAYAPNFVDELNRAIETRGRGDCSAQATPAPGSAAPDGSTATPGKVSAGPTPKPPKGAVSERVSAIEDFKAPSLEPDRSTPGALAATGGVVGLIALIAVAALGARMLRHRRSPVLAIGPAAHRPRHEGPRTAEDRLREQQERAARRLSQRH